MKEYLINLSVVNNVLFSALAWFAAVFKADDISPVTVAGITFWFGTSILGLVARLQTKDTTP